MKKTKLLVLLLTFCLFVSAFAITGLTDNAAEATDSPLRGDVSNDQKVNTRDVIVLRKYLADLDYQTGVSSIEISDLADMNEDNVINVRDLFLLRYFIVNNKYYIEPETNKPEVDTTEPEVDTTEPEVDTTEPEVDTTEPEADTTEPEADTTEQKPETDIFDTEEITFPEMPV